MHHYFAWLTTCTASTWVWWVFNLPT